MGNIIIVFDFCELFLFDSLNQYHECKSSFKQTESGNADIVEFDFFLLDYLEQKMEEALESISAKLMETGKLTKYIKEGHLAIVSLDIDGDAESYEIIISPRIL